MKAHQTPWTPDLAHKMKGKVDPKPQYQRGSVWTRKQKQLLMDSIFRGMDIPKLYLRSLDDGGPYTFEVVDGQQRLRTIWESTTASTPSPRTPNSLSAGSMSPA